MINLDFYQITRYETRSFNRFHLMGSDHVCDVSQTAELLLSPKSLFLYRELIKYEHSKC